MKSSTNVKAIDVVKQMVADGQISQDVAEKYFPELKESEDEAHIDSLLKRLEGICKPGAAFISTRFAIIEDKNWLKSLKDRIQPKVELTQLDKNILEAAIAFVEQNNHFNCWRGVDKHTVLSALHSLRPQKQCKPSEEQMAALLVAVGDEKKLGSDVSKELYELYLQLKQL